MKIIVATHNEGKLAEIRRILEERLGADAADIELVSAGSLGLPDPVEDGVTFQENALIKARAVSEKLGCIALADDSGLCMYALRGAPGIYSARFCGRHGDDKANNRLLLEKLSDETDRRGYFESAVAICFPDGRTLTASGRTFGVILPEEHGENGFGYDPLFFSTEIDKCFGIASAEEKNAVSHRGRALRALAEKMRAEGIL